MGKELPSNADFQLDVRSFKKLEPSTFNSSVVPVVVITAESMYCVGTAFCIGSRGVWVTARHVLDGRGGALEMRDRNPGSRIAILWVGSGVGHDVPELLGGAIPVRIMSRHPESGSDLALLAAIMPGIKFPPLRLSARLPTPRTPILGLGYARFEVESDETVRQQRNINVEPNFHASSGTVLQLFEHGRDTFRDLDGKFTGKLPTICFETSARFDAGMSGGPVIDPSGSVCGVISTGLEQDADDAQETSFVSATPYLFMIGLPVANKTMRVYEMVQQGLVACDNSFERLRLVERDDLVHVYYDADP
jgi:hypothetical protein